VTLLIAARLAQKRDRLAEFRLREPSPYDFKFIQLLSVSHGPISRLLHFVQCWLQSAAQ
jgi:hypothetical protein